MRKLILAFTALLFSQLSFGQALQDNATIPVSVTLNSILRLTVTSGGNIQFVFNTMDQYTNGIGNTLGTTTKFSVSSSRNFDVFMGSEDDKLYGVEDITHTLALGVIRHSILGTGSGILMVGPTQLKQIGATADKIVDTGTASANNLYEINWDAGIGASVLNSPADVYVTNVFLNLIPQP